MSSNEIDVKAVDAAKSAGRQNSLVVNDHQKFSEGVTVKGKLFGVEDVKKETGDDVCNDAMIKLKAIVAVKKEHKQRINIRVNLEGIEIIDEKENKSLYKHSVNRISYIARDLKDSRAIGYIYKNEENEFQYFGIKTEKQAQEFFNLLKDLFQVVLEMRSAGKTTKPYPSDPQAKPAVETIPVEVKSEPVFDESDKAQLISKDDEATEIVQVATQKAPELFDFAAEPAPVAASKPAVVDDPFGLGDLSLDPAPVNASAMSQPSELKMDNGFFSMMNAPAPNSTNQNFSTSPNSMNLNSSNNLFGNAGSMPFVSNTQNNNVFASSFGNQSVNNQFQVPTRSAPTIPPASNSNTNMLNLDPFDSLFK